MIGISIVLLITFLCLALPGLLFYPTKVTTGAIGNHMVFAPQNIADFPHYVFIWKLTMWVFLVSRTLQPILILTSDKELKLKSKQFVMAES